MRSCNLIKSSVASLTLSFTHNSIHFSEKTHQLRHAHTETQFNVDTKSESSTLKILMIQGLSITTCSTCFNPRARRFIQSRYEPTTVWPVPWLSQITASRLMSIFIRNQTWWCCSVVTGKSSTTGCGSVAGRVADSGLIYTSALTKWGIMGKRGTQRHTIVQFYQTIHLV